MGSRCILCIVKNDSLIVISHCHGVIFVTFPIVVEQSFVGMTVCGCRTSVYVELCLF